MPLTPRTVGHLAAVGHEAVHASEVGLGSAPDSAIMERARAEGRIVVTADLDYPRLLAQQGADNPALILFRGGSFSDEEMLELLDRVLAVSSERDLERSITVIDRRRIRRRRLPIAE
jgi:predicted nuclease of predicted toxin-antitoxin system